MKRGVDGMGEGRDSNAWEYGVILKAAVASKRFPDDWLRREYTEPGLKQCSVLCMSSVRLICGTVLLVFSCLFLTDSDSICELEQGPDHLATREFLKEERERKPEFSR